MVLKVSLVVMDYFFWNRHLVQRKPRLLIPGDVPSSRHPKGAVRTQGDSRENFTTQGVFAKGLRTRHSDHLHPIVGYQTLMHHICLVQGSNTRPPVRVIKCVLPSGQIVIEIDVKEAKSADREEADRNKENFREEGINKRIRKKVISNPTVEKKSLNVKSGTRPVFSVKVLIVSNAVLNDEYAARVSATVPHSSSFRSPLLSVNSPLQISFTASVPQQDPQKMKMPLKQQQKQATEMPSPKIASNFPNPEIPKLYDPTQSHETTQPEREQKNFPRLPFGLQQQKVAMDPTQNSNRKTEMPSVDHSVQTFGFPPLEDREKSVSIKTILPLGRIGKFVKRESIKLQHEPNLQHEPYAQFTEEEKKRREIRAKIMLLNFKVLNPFIQRQLTVDVELSRRI
ncbi:hypothetical protein LXL04_011656 [Taraxacum kok-saghyz]